MKLTWKDLLAMAIVGISTTYPMWVGMLKKSEVIGSEVPGIVDATVHWPVNDPSPLTISIPDQLPNLTADKPIPPTPLMISCWWGHDYYMRCVDSKGKSRVRR